MCRSIDVIIYIFLVFDIYCFNTILTLPVTVAHLGQVSAALAASGRDGIPHVVLPLRPAAAWGEVKGVRHAALANITANVCASDHAIIDFNGLYERVCMSTIASAARVLTCGRARAGVGAGARTKLIIGGGVCL